MLDIKQVQEEAEKEVREERMKKAKGRLKDSLAKIEAAKTVLENLKREHQDLLQAIADGN